MHAEQLDNTGIHQALYQLTALSGKIVLELEVEANSSISVHRLSSTIMSKCSSVQLTGFGCALCRMINGICCQLHPFFPKAIASAETRELFVEMVITCHLGP